MLYCDPCGSARSWPTGLIYRSKGPCEVCEVVSLCNDVPSSKLGYRWAEVEESQGKKKASAQEVLRALNEFEHLARVCARCISQLNHDQAVEALVCLSEISAELVTSFLPEHPEGYEGTCQCKTCQ